MDLLDYTCAEGFAGSYLSTMFARGTGKLPQIGPEVGVHSFIVLEG